jgi:DNA-binding response OmpR family regulator
VFSILLIAKESEAATELHSRLTENGIVCSLSCDKDKAVEQVTEQAPDLVLLEVNSRSGVLELSKQIKQGKHLPIIALVHQEFLDSVDGHLTGINDFVVVPYNLPELELRIKRLLHETNNTEANELIRCGDLVIDLARCEVTLAGKQIELTFREYELLRFLVSNRGRVFTREGLLNKVWGYDYYGGDRTVDVHIRRLRSKIDDSSHTFIETVRSIGYRFKKDTEHL